MKKGQVAIYGIMMAIMVLITAVSLITPVKDQAVTARDTDHLNCTNPNATNGQKMTCLQADLMLFYFFAGCMVVAGAYLFYKAKTQ